VSDQVAADLRAPESKGQRTRQAILREAASLSTLDGLEGLSIGTLAAALGMSKSGLYAHFGSKQELQLATIDEAGRIFFDEVVTPALVAPAGLAQIRTLCDSFFDHLTRRTFPGGCFFAGAVLEVGTRPGPVKQRIVEFQQMFVGLVRDFAVTAIEQGELVDEVPEQLAFEINGLLLAADAGFVLSDDAASLEIPRAVLRRRLAAAN
jgi:AcrR family transcriptional regulator